MLATSPDSESVSSSPDNWFVYMILCSDDSLYTGITNNLARRFCQHQNLQGAKYFRAKNPVRVVYAETGHNRSSASKREFVIKQLKPDEKRRLITAKSNQLKMLCDLILTE